MGSEGRDEGVVRGITLRRKQIQQRVPLGQRRQKWMRDEEFSRAIRQVEEYEQRAQLQDGFDRGVDTKHLVAYRGARDPADRRPRPR